MIVVIIVSSILLLAVALGAFILARRALEADSPERRFLRTLWIQAGSTIFYAIATWLYIFIIPDLQTAVLWAMLWIVGTGLFAGQFLLTVTNWRGWGRRLWKFRFGKSRQCLPYWRPRDPRLVLTALIAAPLVLLGDVVLLIVLIAR